MDPAKPDLPLLTPSTSNPQHCHIAAHSTIHCRSGTKRSRFKRITLKRSRIICHPPGEFFSYLKVVNTHTPTCSHTSSTMITLLDKKRISSTACLIGELSHFFVNNFIWKLSYPAIPLTCLLAVSLATLTL